MIHRKVTATGRVQWVGGRSGCIHLPESARASRNRIKPKSSTGKAVSQLEALFSCGRFIWLDEEAKVEVCRGGREVLTVTVADFGPGNLYS